jgi:predicted alpha/beta-fold hydrolase
MRGLAAKGYRAGFSVLLLNQRNCGGTEHLGPGLYHSGLTHDADHVMREVMRTEAVDRIVVAGYSLGGNLALKLAGEYGVTAPPALRGVCAVSPVIELSRCVHALERRQNVIYQWNFVRGLRARMRRKDKCQPGRFDLSPLRSIRTVREFDDRYTAPHFGFESAEDYYHRASAMRVVNRIRVPTLIITSQDDPFVPSEPFRDPAVTGNPHITVVITRHGGHCAFLGEAGAATDGYWAEDRIVEFARDRAG